MYLKLSRTFLLGLIAHAQVSQGLPGRKDLRKRDDNTEVTRVTMRAHDAHLIKHTLSRISGGKIIERAGFTLGGGLARGGGRAADDVHPGQPAASQSYFNFDSSEASSSGSGSRSNSPDSVGPITDARYDADRASAGSPGAQANVPEKLEWQKNEQDTIQLLGIPTRTDLDDAIRANLPDTGRFRLTPDGQRFEDSGYMLSSGPIDSDLAPYLKPENKYGIKTEASDIWTSSKISPPGGGPKGSILSTTANSERETMVVSFTNKQKDYDPTPEPQNVRFSDLLMATWRNVVAQGPPGKTVQDLKFLIRKQVVYFPPEKATTRTGLDGVAVDMDLNTPKAMADVRGRMGGNDKIILSAQAQEGVEKECFDLMAAQTHVSRVYTMLREYHGELNNLRISKIHLHFAQDNDIVLELGRW